MSEYMDYIEKLKSDINYQVNQKFEYFIETQQLKKQNDKQNEYIKLIRNDLLRAESMEDYWKINSSELEYENIKLKKERKGWIKEYKSFDEKCSKLSDELSLKIRHNHIQSLEINELKQELKEYRGF